MSKSSKLYIIGLELKKMTPHVKVIKIYCIHLYFHYSLKMSLLHKFLISVYFKTFSSVQSQDLSSDISLLFGKSKDLWWVGLWGHWAEERSQRLNQRVTSLLRIHEISSIHGTELRHHFSNYCLLAYVL